MEEIRNTKKVLEKQSNSEFQCLTSNPTRSSGPPNFDLDVLHIHEKLRR
jgi:hypothetical protein